VLPCQGGCGALVAKSGKCPGCRGREDRQRVRVGKELYDARWRKESKLFLRLNPICVGLPDGTHVHRCDGAATVVDHRIPHRGDPVLFWDAGNNWAAMNKHCHDSKTVRFDGGFAQPRRHIQQG
jgi:5-methylcytosine-specific restriction protein A